MVPFLTPLILRCCIPQGNDRRSSIGGRARGVRDRDVADALDDTGVGGLQDCDELRYVQQVLRVLTAMLRWLQLPRNTAYVPRRSAGHNTTPSHGHRRAYATPPRVL